MARYLLTFSYIGTGFRGASRTVKNAVCNETIQGNLELGLLQLRPKVFPSVYISSRTDAGVHALSNTAHVDLETVTGNAYRCEDIQKLLNRYFNKNEKDILVRNVRRVAPTFSSRLNALSRTYLYRLAVLKHDGKVRDNVYLPIEESLRLYYVRDEGFEIDRVKDAIKLFEGTHDFRTFKKFIKVNSWRSCRKIIYSADVTEGEPSVTSFTRERLDYLDYWEFRFRGKGFVHNQIRRMVGTLVGVGYGKLNSNDVLTMLRIPSQKSWPPFISTAPPFGLYLCSVEYNEDDLNYTPDCV